MCVGLCEEPARPLVAAWGHGGRGCSCSRRTLEHLRIGDPPRPIRTGRRPPTRTRFWIIAGTALLVAIVGAIFGWRRARLLRPDRYDVRDGRPRPGPCCAPFHRGPRPAAGLAGRTRICGSGRRPCRLADGRLDASGWTTGGLPEGGCARAASVAFSPFGRRLASVSSHNASRFTRAFSAAPTPGHRHVRRRRRCAWPRAGSRPTS